MPHGTMYCFVCYGRLEKQKSCQKKRVRNYYSTKHQKGWEVKKFTMAAGWEYSFAALFSLLVIVRTDCKSEGNTYIICKCEKELLLPLASLTTTKDVFHFQIMLTTGTM